MKSLDYQRLSSQVIEVKKMRASLIHKLRTDRFKQEADY
jgi:hypothetical protein